MIPFYKYHPESGTVIARIVVVNKESLAQHAQEGYSFIASPADTFLNVYVDPITKEIHNTIPYTLPEDRSASFGESYLVDDLPKPCWVLVSGKLPEFVEDGQISIDSNDEGEASYQLVGAYTSNLCSITWKSLSEIKIEAKAKVDAGAEAAREALQTQGSGQAMTYLRKADAARAHLSGFPISEAQLARLQQEADRLEMSLDDVSRLIVEKADAWELRDLQIDALRLNSKSAIDSATTGKEIENILDSIDWG